MPSGLCGICCMLAVGGSAGAGSRGSRVTPARNSAFLPPPTMSEGANVEKQSLSCPFGTERFSVISCVGLHRLPETLKTLFPPPPALTYQK